MYDFKVPLNGLELKLGQLKRFNTRQEIDALLIDEEKSIIEVVKQLTDIVPKNELEAEAFLIKLREISVSDVYDITTTCSSCGGVNNVIFESSELLNLEPYYYNNIKLPVGFYDSVEEIINNTETLLIKEYDEINDILEKQNKSILCTINKPCRKCKNTMLLNIDNRSSISKSTLASIYQEFIDISVYTNNGVLDINSLYPFEREMYMSLIQNKLDKGQ